MSELSAKAIKLKNKREASKLICNIYESTYSGSNKVKKINVDEGHCKESSKESCEPSVSSNVNKCNDSVFLSSDSSSEFEDFREEISKNEEMNITEKLRKWAIENNICNSALNDLLQILREHNVSVPKDCRTLKKPQRRLPLAVWERVSTVIMA